MRFFLIFALLPIAAFAQVDSDVETIKSDDGKPISRTLTVSSSGIPVYRLFEALDLTLVGDKMPLFKESFYVHDRLILNIRWFSEDSPPAYEFFSFGDYKIDVAPLGQRRITITSQQKDKIIEWTEDEKGFPTVYSESALSQKQKTEQGAAANP